MVSRTTPTTAFRLMGHQPKTLEEHIIANRAKANREVQKYILIGASLERVRTIRERYMAMGLWIRLGGRKHGEVVIVRGERMHAGWPNLCPCPTCNNDYEWLRSYGYFG